MSMVSGVASINTRMMSFVTGTENVKAMIIKETESKGSIIIHVGFKYKITEAMTTPKD